MAAPQWMAYRAAVATWKRSRARQHSECRRACQRRCPDRLLDVLDLLRTEVRERQRQNLLDLLVSGTRDTDAARLRQCLQTRRDVHTVTKQITTTNHHV